MPFHFPAALDSTMLATYKACPYKFFLQYCCHWKPRGESVHLIAGGAFARGLEVARKSFYADGLSESDSIAAGIDALVTKYGDFVPAFDTPKTCERMMGALEYYFSIWPLSDDIAPPLRLESGGYAIEFSFALPFHSFTHPETGNPLLYSGRADLIGHFAGANYVIDEKTTSQLGSSWGKQWENRSQFTAYVWAARTFGVEVAGAIVRGVSILKTKYDTAQVVTQRPAWEVERWEQTTCQIIERMLDAWSKYQSGLDPQLAFPLNLDHACGEYAGCSLLTVCKSRDPQTWLETQFEQRVWDPLVHSEISVAEYDTRFSR